ncbi:AraC family transcriptional regulator [Phreatobacter sp. AB_2022a]|uniref:AraC family transcriptional regulator n=1 Tax=Phreatobacter sp. AB_2022a TaxID=3003134 RepID=UPI0022876AFF|nr:helix-turn-helix transcriptional regulator [Phreatobacter sp. AB_2022a]MCZ0734393.1 helix-turn-helix transcriptional regulator [Phreatobacter sp. AB_2022a]
MPDAFDRADGPLVIALRGNDRDDGPYRLGTRELDWHRHVRGQLFCIESGLVHVRSRHGSWLLPPNRAGWIPPGSDHKVSLSGVISGWVVMIRPDGCGMLPAKPRVSGISEVLGALVRRAVTWAMADTLSADQLRLAAVLIDEVARAPREPLHLPMPRDRRLARIATAIARRPADARTLDDWARWAGLAPRTARRLFQAETGSSFGRWRQQARLVAALERLARGDAVAEVSDAVGYATPSAFIAMFRQAMGASPARYFAGRPGRL